MYGSDSGLVTRSAFKAARPLVDPWGGGFDSHPLPPISGARQVFDSKGSVNPLKPIPDHLRHPSWMARVGEATRLAAIGLVLLAAVGGMARVGLDLFLGWGGDERQIRNVRSQLRLGMRQSELNALVAGTPGVSVLCSEAVGYAPPCREFRILEHMWILDVHFDATGALDRIGEAGETE